MAEGDKGEYIDKWNKALGIGHLADEYKQERIDIDFAKMQLEEALSSEKLAGSEGPDLFNTTEEATYDREQVVDLAKQDINMLAGLAIPSIFEHCFPPVLIAVWMLLKNKVDLINDFSKLALGLPRGHGKTTLIKLFILYCILFTKKQFILVISDTGLKAENILADVIDMLNEPNIRTLFGSWQLGAEKSTQALYKFTFRGRSIILVAIGAGGSLRGINLKNARPDVMIFEDVQSKECSESIVQSEALKRWLIGTAMKAKSPKGCLYIYVGNMFPGDQCILKGFKKNPNWTKFISGAILADGSALWPALHSITALIDEFDNDIEMGHPEIFLSEVMNDTEVGINKKIDLTTLKDWRWTKDDKPQGKFILIDPAGFKQNADATAIGLFHIYDEIPCLLQCWEEILSPGNTIRKVILIGLQNNCRTIVCESIGYQGTLLYWFEQVCSQLQIVGFQFLEVSDTRNSKNARISDSLKELSAGEIILHPDTRSQISHQIVNWNPLKRENVDGLLDLLGHAKRCVQLHGPLMLTDEAIHLMGSMTTGVDEDTVPF